MSERRDYTMAEIRRIAEDWTANVPISDICEKYDRSSSSLFYMMAQHRNIFPRRVNPASPSKINRRELLALKGKGVSVAEISKHFGAHKTSIYAALKSIRAGQKTQMQTGVSDE